ncbi:MAG TPA: tetratricopeptide repeat protein, partial [Anaerolineae bacterium]|nr:tetratricopeptide repeat protein [Anaerolineae bacterium]
EALEELPDWLAELQPPAATETAAPAVQPAEAEELFGWDAFASAPAEAAAAAGEEALEELPDWLAELQPPAAAKAPAAAEELPDWLAELQPPAAAKAPAAAEELPDWLAELQPPAGPAAPALEGELLSGDDALAWLASLAAGKEEELRAQAETETRARVDEIMGRKPAAPLPTPPAAPAAPVAEEIVAPVEAVAPEAAPALEGELLSGDDALAWLASLAAGKEEELRAQAETETRARVDEIMGRKPAAPLPTPPAAPAAPVAEEIVAPVEAVAPEAAPALEGELLSGDDALAWLASLAAGKEEELRAQAETETRARVDEIMGRKPAAPLPTPPAAPAAPVAEEIVAPVEAVAPEAAPALEEEALAAPEEAVPAGAPIVAGTEEETFFGWLTFDAEIAEAPKVPEPEILEPQPLPSFGFTRFGPNGEPLMEQGPEEIKIAGPILVEPEAVKPEMVEAEAPVIPEPAPTAPLEALRARTEADARDYLTRLELARALVSANEWQEALTHYRRLIRDKQRLPEIEADLTQLTGRQPDDPRLLQMLGDLHMQKGQLDQALALYKRAISLL